MSTSPARRSPMLDLFASLQSGAISRREFLTRAAGLGMAGAVALNAIQSVSAQTPAASVPGGGDTGMTRGQGGELRLLQWQAPTTMAQHTALGGKDNLAATFILEPLLHFLPDGSMIPNLVTQVPSVENGQLAADSSSVTYSLIPGVTWSDGTPFTANDVKFTWEWVTDPANGTSTIDLYTSISSVEVVDDLTVTLTFTGPQPGWYVPFSGSWWGVVYPRHILEGKGPEAYDAFQVNPIGTGPYVLESFEPGDQAMYVANPGFRIPDRPIFDRIVLKGGGDAASAARAVLQTGDYDFAWNLQVEPDVLESLMGSGNGSVMVVAGGSLEQIYINFSDPRTEVDGEFSSLKAPHPFLTDPVVRQAFALCINRDLIASTFYGEGEPASSNVLVGIPAMESPNTSFSFDVDEANRLLDEAGWIREGDARSKDGVELSVSYATTINSVRQKTQAVVKQGLEAIGVKVELKQVDAGTYFDTSPGNTQGYIQFYDDLGMSTAGIDTPFPLKYMNRWYAGKDNSNVPQKANNWGGQDLSRYVSPEYDALYDQVSVEPDAAKVAEIFIAMNDHLIADNAVIPLVQRAAEKLAVGSRLNADTIAAGPFETPYWNIANWAPVEG